MYSDFIVLALGAILFYTFWCDGIARKYVKLRNDALKIPHYYFNNTNSIGFPVLALPNSDLSSDASLPASLQYVMPNVPTKHLSVSAPLLARALGIILPDSPDEQRKVLLSKIPVDGLPATIVINGSYLYCVFIRDFIYSTEDIVELDPRSLPSNSKCRDGDTVQVTVLKESDVVMFGHESALAGKRKALRTYRNYVSRVQEALLT